MIHILMNINCIANCGTLFESLEYPGPKTFTRNIKPGFLRCAEIYLWNIPSYIFDENFENFKNIFITNLMIWNIVFIYILNRPQTVCVKCFWYILAMLNEQQIYNIC